MTNKDKFFTNLKITLAVKKRNKLRKMSPVSDAAISNLDSTIKRLETSLKENS